MILVNLFPEQLSIHGDGGNALALQQRAAWAGLKLEVHDLHPGQQLPPEVDGIVIGSGPEYVLDDLQQEVLRLAPPLQQLKAAGKPFLAISAGWQLLSKEFTLSDARRLSGAGIYPVYCERAAVRRVGDAVISSALGQLAGFENHAIAPVYEQDNPLGQGRHGAHGFFADNLLACCLHGAFLPINPAAADWFLSKMSGQPIQQTHQPADTYAQKAREAITRRAGL